MASRRSAPSIRSMLGSLAATDVANFLRFLDTLLILRGVFVDAVFNNALSVEVRHPLGRRYYGAIKVRKSEASHEAVTVIHPDVYESDGGNPATHVRLNAGINAGDRYTGTVTLWVF